MTQAISCIIRTRNEARHLGWLIETLRSQEPHGRELEIVVVDSGSTDGTVRIARDRGVHLIEIPSTQFTYSSSLNLGIESSQGEILVILSAHAIPCDTDWLQRVTRHFEDPRVAGVFCRQVPFSDAGFAEILRLEETFGSKSLVFTQPQPEAGLPFSNAASCIRRSVWQAHPFEILPAAEDREWASWVLAHGCTIVYDAEARIQHSHRDTPRQAARRTVELEKACDLRLGRRRTCVLTLRQGLGRFVRNMRTVWRSDLCRGKRLSCSWQSLAEACWFVREFLARRNRGAFGSA